MKIKLFIGALLAAFLGVGITNSASALDLVPPPEPTLALQETNDSSILRFGQNLLQAGNDLSESATANGIIFSAGNQLVLKNKSEYAFVAGNIIDFSATTARDLFIAGNIINLTKDAKIGRDTFVTGNTVTVNANLPGNFATAASKVTFNNVKIDGNVDLSAGYIVFEGKVEIAGKLSFNENADVVGLGNATYAELEKYEVVEYTITSTELWIARILTILGLFVTTVIVMALFPAMDRRVAKEVNLVQFGKDLVIGLVTLIGVPFIVIFLLLSFFAAPAGLVLLAVYIVSLYLAQGFTGLYLGKVIFEQLFKGKMNQFVEALVGIVIIVLLSIISPLVSVLAIILGLGLIMQSIKPDRKKGAKKTSSKSRPDPEDLEEAKVVFVKDGEVAKEKTPTKSSTKKSPKNEEAEDTELGEEE